MISSRRVAVHRFSRARRRPADLLLRSSLPACRKRLWQQAKRRIDPDYRANQRSAQQAWEDRNRWHSQQWRQVKGASTPASSVRNARTNASRAQPRLPPVKMDAWTPAPSGLFRLTKIPDFSGETSLSWIVAIVPADVSSPVKMDV